VDKGNLNSVTDAGVGVQIAFAGVIGGNFNVLINLPQIKDDQFKEEMKSTCAKLETEARNILDDTLKVVKEKIASLSK
jgi:formiminotetrahydrofolate cyclodeaminase